LREKIEHRRTTKANLPLTSCFEGQQGIDHHARMTEPHQQGAVAEMAAGPDLDLAPGAEKGELDAALLALLDRDPLLVLLSLWTLGQSYRGLNSGRSE
jgi:hypothetical protein